MKKYLSLIEKYIYLNILKHIIYCTHLTFNSELIHFNAFKQVKKKNQPLYPP